MEVCEWHEGKLYENATHGSKPTTPHCEFDILKFSTSQTLMLCDYQAFCTFSVLSYDPAAKDP